MEISESPFRNRLTDRERRGVGLFGEYLWHNKEVCNECFARVRDIGPRRTVTLQEGRHRDLSEGPPQSIETNEWYKRTEVGSQEHSPGDHNKRFGTCYCTECGGDLRGNHRDKSIEELAYPAKNIARYARKHTPLKLDPRRFGTELVDLKRTPEYQSWETEVLAVAFARSIRR